MLSLALNLHPTPHQIEKFWSKVAISTPEACWPWTGFKNPAGYGHVTIDKIGIRTHRVAWVISHGKIPAGMLVMHACDNPSCCNPAHLALGTALDNTRDCVAKGRKFHASGGLLKDGSRRVGTKLTDATAMSIFSLHATGMTQKDIGVKLGVHQSTVGRIIHGKRWAARIGELQSQSA